MWEHEAKSVPVIQVKCLYDWRLELSYLDVAFFNELNELNELQGCLFVFLTDVLVIADTFQRSEPARSDITARIIFFEVFKVPRAWRSGAKIHMNKGHGVSL